MKTNITPGPWHVGPEYENRDSRSVWFGSFSGTAQTVCRYVRSDADARLIAAAPEQHAILVEMADFMRAFLIDYGDKLLSPAAKAGTESMLRRANAAIAKATGTDAKS